MSCILYALLGCVMLYTLSYTLKPTPQVHTIPFLDLLLAAPLKPHTRKHILAVSKGNLDVHGIRLLPVNSSGNPPKQRVTDYDGTHWNQSNLSV